MTGYDTLHPHDSVEPPLPGIPVASIDAEFANPAPGQLAAEMQHAQAVQSTVGETAMAGAVEYIMPAVHAEKVTTSNGHEIKNPTEKMSADAYKTMLAAEFGITGMSAQERVGQLKKLSNEGIAIMLEKINMAVQGSADSLMSHDRTIHIGSQDTIPLEHRGAVFTEMIDAIKQSPDETNPARVADVLALGVVMLHPFHDGNGRTARIIGLTFRDGFEGPDFEDDFAVVSQSRDLARQKGEFMIYGYVPHLPEGADQSDPQQTVDYLKKLLTEEYPGAYTGCFGQAPLSAP